MHWPFLGILILNLTLALTGDTLAKMWSLNPTPKLFMIALSVGIVTVISFMLVVREGGLAIGSTLALVLTIMGNVAIGYLVFKESIVLSQWLGIILGCIAISLILYAPRLAT